MHRTTVNRITFGCLVVGKRRQSSAGWFLCQPKVPEVRCVESLVLQNSTHHGRPRLKELQTRCNSCRQHARGTCICAKTTSPRYSRVSLQQQRQRVQEVFSQLFIMEGWAAIANPRAYVLRVLRNLAIERIHHSHSIEFQHGSRHCVAERCQQAFNLRVFQKPGKDLASVPKFFIPN